MPIKINNTDFIFHINVGNLDNKQHWTIDWCYDQCLTGSWTFIQIYSKGFGDCIVFNFNNIVDASAAKLRFSDMLPKRIQ